MHHKFLGNPGFPASLCKQRGILWKATSQNKWHERLGKQRWPWWGPLAWCFALFFADSLFCLPPLSLSHTQALTLLGSLSLAHKHKHVLFHILLKTHTLVNNRNKCIVQLILMVSVSMLGGQKIINRQSKRGKSKMVDGRMATCGSAKEVACGGPDCRGGRKHYNESQRGGGDHLPALSPCSASGPWYPPSTEDIADLSPCAKQVLAETSQGHK